MRTNLVSMVCDLLAMGILMGCLRFAKHGRVSEVCAQTRQDIAPWRHHRCGAPPNCLYIVIETFSCQHGSTTPVRKYKPTRSSSRGSSSTQTRSLVCVALRPPFYTGPLTSPRHIGDMLDAPARQGRSRRSASKGQELPAFIPLPFYLPARDYPWSAGLRNAQFARS